MAYDLEEQEQLAELKAWWKRYGNLVLLGVTAALLAIAGHQGWRYYVSTQSLAAASLFGQMEQAERAGDHKKVRDIAAQITDKYRRAPYAPMAALASAKAAVQTGDLAAAQAQLKWVMDNARENELKDLARLRLAGVLLDDNKHAEALDLLSKKPVESLSGLYADLMGDVLSAQGKNADARSAYQQALDKSESGSAYRAVIQLKLDALGGTQ